MNGGHSNDVGTDLDAATVNFDNIFTRLPVETDDNPGDGNDDDENLEELHEDTLVGFTFNDNDYVEMDAIQLSRQQQQQQQITSRQWTHHLDILETNNPAKTRHLD